MTNTNAYIHMYKWSTESEPLLIFLPSTSSLYSDVALCPWQCILHTFRIVSFRFATKCQFSNTANRNFM